MRGRCGLALAVALIATACGGDDGSTLSAGDGDTAKSTLLPTCASLEPVPETPAAQSAAPEIAAAQEWRAAGLVYPTIVLPGGDRSCTSDANPHVYVVALERDGLPAEFTVQLGPEVICTGCEGAGESETTPVNLSP